MTVKYVSDEDADWMWALVKEQHKGPLLYWSIWVGWTTDKALSFLRTHDEVDIESSRSSSFDDRLPLQDGGEWRPVYRRYPLYAERVIDVNDFED